MELELNKENVANHIKLYNSLCDTVRIYLNRTHGIVYDYTGNDPKISFSMDREIITRSYEKNTACNCHPEYSIIEEEYSFDDFIVWANNEGIKLEL